VGRTGSGKSSLTLSLLRCIPTEGEVYYDKLPTASVNLDALRRQCTIIPQAVRFSIMQQFPVIDTSRSRSS
jgi:ABC-type multidrug transport system fused ATPase/permease subunit